MYIQIDPRFIEAYYNSPNCLGKIVKIIKIKRYKSKKIKENKKISKKYNSSIL